MNCRSLLPVTLATAGLILTPAVWSNPAPDAEEMVTTLNVRYAETPGVEAGAQSLDIYAPKAAQKLPVIVYIHGGGWGKGDKHDVGAKPQFFTSAAWLLVSINYRLLPAGRHPANVEDVAKALAWVHSKIARHGGDPARLFVIGHSAGAHLAALVATDERRLAAAGKGLDILKGVIPLDTGVYDGTKLRLDAKAEAVYKKIFTNDVQIWRDASPYYHVTGGRKFPPFLIFYSRGTGADGESEMRVAQANAFAKALRKTGSPAEVFDASDRSHGEINQWFGRPADRVTAKTMEFLNSLAGGR